MLTVLEVIRQGEIGGGESHVIDLVRELDRSKIRPVVVAYTDGPMITALRGEGVTCHVVPTLRAFDVTVWDRLAKLARQEKADVIHAHGTRAASNLLYAVRKTGIPMVYTVHGWSFHQDQHRLAYWMRAMSEKLICHVAHRVICVSQTNLETGLRAFGLKTRKTDVIENGVNTTVFDPGRDELDGLRRDFGFAASDVVAGFVARATKQKGPLYFVQAVEQANKANPKVKGLFVGEGDMRAEVERYVRQHRLEKVVRLSPFRKDVPRVLKAIDIYCLPSLWEGLSIALLEAMAMAKPLVVTPTDGTREIITDGENGLVIPFENAAALAEAILRSAAAPAEAAKMGAEGRKVVLSRFDSRRVARHVADIYERLILSR